MKEIANKYIIALLSVIMVCLMAAPVMAGCACDVSTNGACSYGTNGTVNGTVHVDGNNHPDTIGDDPDRTFYSEFDVPNGTIKWARLYWHIWGGSYGDYGWSNATFCNNSSGTFTNNRSINDPCEQNDSMGWYKGGCGTHWLYWNVTDDVSTGPNNLTVNNSYNATWDGRVMYMVLVVVLDDMEGYPPTNYWINQGYMDIDTEESHTTWFNGTINNSASATNLTLWHLSLCSNGNLSIWFNDHLVKNYPGGTGFGSDLPEPTPEIIDKVWVDGTAQNMTWENIADPWLHPVLAILVDYTPPVDLMVTNIDPEQLRPDNESTVYATVKNLGDNSTTSGFNVSLYVDGAWNDTEYISVLNASESKTVDFTVNLSKGCYEFKVVADVNSSVVESNEKNNEASVNCQVGYVIVIESDSDFEKLNTSGSSALPQDCFKNESGTYYIQNLTGSYSIENCAGVGITIKNTNATFVINNCTIKNCTKSGVFFHNLENGTINGSTVQNNAKYGIEVGMVPLDSNDPEFVDITNNTIEENLYGIELIGFNCTVKNNTIKDNTKYGIYLFADDTNVTDGNIIVDNTDYGVMLYNSSRSYVYCNNLTNNNAGNSGYQAWDNGNTNHWNTTTGNYWSDWQSNSGYPCNYSIDGDSNKDYVPKGARTITLEVSSAEKVDGGVTDVTGDVNNSGGGSASIVCNPNESPLPHVQVNFSTDIPDGSGINSVIFNYRHRELYSSGVSVHIDVYDGDTGAWTRKGSYDPTNGPYCNSSIDVTTCINTTAEAEDAKVRYLIERTGGGSKTGSLDYANLTITYTP